MSETPEREEWEPFRGRNVVLDTRGEIIYIGRLETIGDWFLELREADVHDVHSTRTSKELYIMEAAKHGVKVNRESVSVRKGEVVSVSALDDVRIYY